jgi:malate dehydrogenase (oxaloacetate-decarboxylating)
VATWTVSADYPSLLDVVNNAKPDLLIGVSGQPGLFTEEVVKAMQSHCEVPIIFPLSNPSRQVEARPEQVIEWTNGNVVIATGSPFAPVQYEGKTYPIAQCNNSYIFPGIGLGVLASKARLISDEMLMAASNALADASPLARGESEHLLPPLTKITELSKSIAFEVAKVAMAQDLALTLSDEMLKERIEKNFWRAQYRPFKRVSL